MHLTNLADLGDKRNDPSPVVPYKMHCDEVQQILFFKSDQVKRNHRGFNI